MKTYCAEENLGFRILLIVDNAVAAMLDYVSLYENVKIICMPLRTTLVMQSVVQGVNTALKAYY
jgi:hypothetical protein